MRIICPICKKVTTWEENPARPFCSPRCKLIDLGRWAGGQYRIPSEEPVQPSGTEENKNDEKKNNDAESHEK